MESLQHPTIFLEEKIHRKNNQLLIKFDYDETLISHPGLAHKKPITPPKLD